jgi:hypothetical protein
MARISCLYLPLIDILIENMARLSANPGNLSTTLKSNSETSNIQSAFVNPNGSISVATLIPPTNPSISSISISNGYPINNENNRPSDTSTLLGVIAGIVNPNKLQDHMDNLMSDNDSLSSTDDTNFKHMNKRTSYSLITASTTGSGEHSNSLNVNSIVSTTETIKSYSVTRKDKLDSNEVRDLLICALFVLKHISDGQFNSFEKKN